MIRQCSTPLLALASETKHSDASDEDDSSNAANDASDDAADDCCFASFRVAGGVGEDPCGTGRRWRLGHEKTGKCGITPIRVVWTVLVVLLYSVGSGVNSCVVKC